MYNASATRSYSFIRHATKSIIALSGLRHLRLEQMRQIYQAFVTLSVGYVSAAWHDPLRDKPRHHLNTVQRTALSRILSAFMTAGVSVGFKRAESR
jgi:hypothetical protein